MSTDSDMWPVLATQLQPSFAKRIVGYAGRTARRIGPFMAVAIVSILLLILVSLSPLVLNQIGKFHDIDWIRLSAIGQTYGAASALLTGLALLGVVGSIFFQIRAIQSSTEQSSREHHAHLVEMAMNDPVYRLAWGYDTAFMTDDLDTFRQNAYLNLIISYWERDFVLGEIPDRRLRLMSTSLFGGAAGRMYWATIRNYRLAAAKDRKGRRFIQIVDEEYRNSIRSGPPIVPAKPAPNPPRKTAQDHGERRAQVITAAIGAAVLAATIRRLLRQR